MTLRVGIDVGGTFTDTVVVDERSGEVSVQKRRTTYDGLSRAVMASLAELGGIEQGVSSIFHGTTLVSNAIVQRGGRRRA